MYFYKKTNSLGKAFESPGWYKIMEYIPLNKNITSATGWNTYNVDIILKRSFNYAQNESYKISLYARNVFSVLELNKKYTTTCVLTKIRHTLTNDNKHSFIEVYYTMNQPNWLYYQAQNAECIDGYWKTIPNTPIEETGDFTVLSQLDLYNVA